MTRFWASIDKRGDAECWPWIGRLDNAGYGLFYDRDQVLNAHRVSYTILKGEIAAGQHVLHMCDNPACVNPAHLALGSHADNMADMARKERGSQKLSAEQIREIRESAARHRVIARQFGVNQSTITRIKNGLRRQHV